MKSGSEVQYAASVMRAAKRCVMAQAGYDLRFYEIRNLEEDRKEKKHRVIRVSVCVAQHGELKARAVALCHWKDNPSRVVGRAIAARRIVQLMRHGVMLGQVTITMQETVCDTLLREVGPKGKRDEGITRGMRLELHRWLFAKELTEATKDKRSDALRIHGTSDKSVEIYYGIKPFEVHTGCMPLILADQIENFFPYEENLFKPKKVETHLIKIVCEEQSCPKRNTVINTVQVPDSELEAYLEGFGHGSEEDKDYCPECRVLGVVEEEEAVNSTTEGPLP